MDVVVRTPHGRADVRLRAWTPDATLADLLHAVTDQAVPGVARVDGALVETSAPIDGLGLRIGSDVATELQLDEDGIVSLVQLTGPGAGTRRELAPGTYRLGPGRRLHADELHRGTVEAAIVEISVAPGPAVTVAPVADAPITIGDAGLVRPASWTDQLLRVAGRSFVLDAPGRSTPAIPSPPAADGTIPFNRRPLGRRVAPRRPLIDARHDIEQLADGLWHRRLTDAEALTVPVGLAPDGVPSTVSIARHRGAAVIGPGRDRAALARALLLELAALHGPADLSLVVATSPDRLADWEWAKWLPHVRCSPMPAVLVHAATMRTWLDHATPQESPGEAATPSPRRRTVVVVDNPDAWLSGTAPLHSLTTAPPEHVHVVVLADSTATAPSSATLLIDVSDPADTVVADLGGGDERRGIDAALPTVELARSLARCLSPLVDIEGDPGATRGAASPPGKGFDSDVSLSTPEELIDACISRSIDVVSSSDRLRDVVIRGRPRRQLLDAAIALTLGAVARLGPAGLTVTRIGGVRSPLAHLDDLPQVDQVVELPSGDDADRFLRRLRHHAASSADDRAMRLLLVDVAGGTDLRASQRLVTSILEITAEAAHLSVVVLADEADHAPPFRSEEADAAAPVPAGTVEIIFEDDPLGLGTVLDGATSTPFAPCPLTAPGAPTNVDVGTFVIGRPPTPLERHLARRARRVDDDRHPTEALVGALDRLAVAGHDRHPGNQLSIVPPPFPRVCDLDELFARYPGDGVPIGLIERHDSVTLEPLWWTPGHSGTMLVLGPPAAELDAVITTVLAGIADRFDPADVGVWIVDAMAGRRAAAARLPHCRRTSGPHDPVEVAAIIDELAGRAETAHADGTATATAPAVLLVHDLSQLVRRLEGAGLGETLHRFAGLLDAGAEAGVDVVAVGRHEEVVDAALGAAMRASPRVTVYEAVEGPRGRCRSQADGSLVQLASPRSDPADTVARRLDDPAGDSTDGSPT